MSGHVRVNRPSKLSSYVSCHDLQCIDQRELVVRSLAMERGESIKPTPPAVKSGTLAEQHIRDSCRAEELHHRDPLGLMQLQLQLYIQNEQYEKAQR